MLHGLTRGSAKSRTMAAAIAVIGSSMFKTSTPSAGSNTAHWESDRLSPQMTARRESFATPRSKTHDWVSYFGSPGGENLYPFQGLGFRAAQLSLWPDMMRLQDERVKQVAIGGSILLVLTVVVTGMWVTWRMLPGLLGEWIGFIVGIMTTPFCMETSFVVIGLVIVIFLNHWRQQRDGDEFVDLADLPRSEIEAKPQDHDDQNPIS